MKKAALIGGSELYPVRIGVDDDLVNEPYKALEGGSFCGQKIKWSPDPLVSYRFGNVQASDGLQLFCAYPASYKTSRQESFLNADSILTPQTNITVKGDGDILFDFGVEFAAWLEIESPDLVQDGSILLSVSEYNMPEAVNKGAESPRKTAVPKQISGTVFRLELNRELYEGVRFGFIHVRGLKKEFHITGVRLVCQVKPANYNGSFECDNELLNRIWYTAAYDVRVNLKKDYISAILVDRGDRHSWTGDAYTAQAASLTAFANYDFVLNNLRYTSAHPNGIESFELYWVLSLIDYFDHTGDRDGVLGLLPEALARLEHAIEVWDNVPDLSFLGWDERLGAGFEDPNTAGNKLSYKALSIECFRRFANVLDCLGNSGEAARLRRIADEKTRELNLDPELFKDCGIHALADAVNAGVLSDNITGKLFEKYLSDRANRISYSPFSEYFILKALAKAGKYDDAISSVIDLWGSQIRYGGTCFFEVWRPDWAEELRKNGPMVNDQAGYTSLAHPWSAGVLPWMSSELLGIKPLVPGFSRFSVTPHPGSFLKRVKGEMPTKYGNIKVSFDFLSGRHSVSVPKNTVAVIGIPKAGRTVTGLKPGGIAAAPDREDDGFYYFDNVQEGDYTFTGDHSGATGKYRAPTYKYPARFLGRGLETNDLPGKEGRYICGNEEESRLPEYVESIGLSNGIVIGEGETAQYATNYDNVCSQTFTLDIKLKYRRRYMVSLFFPSGDDEKSLAVEMFDGRTRELIAPVKVLSDYKGGEYMVYEYDRSARFRIDHVRGDFVSLREICFG
ncbi:MAG: hypothetical protein IJS71_01865 [Clostridia bacterium]|nr:hypothetical protein [Clostridia bacterium]